MEARSYTRARAAGAPTGRRIAGVALNRIMPLQTASFLAGKAPYPDVRWGGTRFSVKNKLS
jgi:hypothetical protein